ncbi:unnamed protein product, partial [Laminaria digitata]
MSQAEQHIMQQFDISPLAGGIGAEVQGLDLTRDIGESV